MKASIIYILVLGMFTLGFAQESQKTLDSEESKKQPVVKEVGKVQGKIDKEVESQALESSEKSDEVNIIDLEKGPQKLKLKQVTNTLSGKDKVRQPMGPADASAPRQKLEKKQEQTSVKKSELLEKLKDPKPIKRKEVE
jgi:hypothetical protein